MLLPLLVAFLLAPVSPAPDEPKAERPPADTFRPDPSWKPLSPDKKTIWFDPDGRRLIVRGRVCLREGALEHLLCLSQTKEHEAVLATDAPARSIHAGLILVAGKPGHPVHYKPKFEPPDGPPVAIDLEWTADGKTLAQGRRQVLDQGREVRQGPDDRLGLRRQRPLRRPRHQADDLRGRRRRPHHRLQLQRGDPRSPHHQLRQRLPNGRLVANTKEIPPRDTPVTLIFRGIKPRAEPAPAKAP